MEPDMNIVRKLEGRLQNVTARGSEADIVSRSFVPGMGISEDPVCGSAHCSIIPYWTEVLGKNEILAYQASERGGYLHCTLQDDGRLLIAGEAVPVAVSELLVEY
jgi:predicted PhzF superfamily epimerase YddE/YHI9